MNTLEHLDSDIQQFADDRALRYRTLDSAELDNRALPIINSALAFFHKEFPVKPGELVNPNSVMYDDSFVDLGPKISHITPKQKADLKSLRYRLDSVARNAFSLQALMTPLFEQSAIDPSFVQHGRLPMLLEEHFRNELLEINLLYAQALDGLPIPELINGVQTIAQRNLPLIVESRKNPHVKFARQEVERIMAVEITLGKKMELDALRKASLEFRVGDSIFGISTMAKAASEIAKHQDSFANLYSLSDKLSFSDWELAFFYHDLRVKRIAALTPVSSALTRRYIQSSQLASEFFVRSLVQPREYLLDALRDVDKSNVVALVDNNAYYRLVRAIPGASSAPPVLTLHTPRVDYLAELQKSLTHSSEGKISYRADIPPAALEVLSLKLQQSLDAFTTAVSQKNISTDLLVQCKQQFDLFNLPQWMDRCSPVEVYDRLNGVLNATASALSTGRVPSNRELKQYFR